METICSKYTKIGAYLSQKFVNGPNYTQLPFNQDTTQNALKAGDEKSFQKTFAHHCSISQKANFGSASHFTYDKDKSCFAAERQDLISSYVPTTFLRISGFPLLFIASHTPTTSACVKAEAGLKEAEMRLQMYRHACKIESGNKKFVCVIHFLQKKFLTKKVQ